MKKIAVCSEEIPRAALRSLEREGFFVLLLPPHPALPKTVACHADILTSALDSTLFFDKIYCETYPEVVSSIASSADCRVVTTEETLCGKYPGDVLFNVLIGPDFALGHSSSSKTLREAVASSGRRFIEVKQGYAACSTLFTGTFLVSSDEGICRAASQFCDVLRISAGHVRLDPYDTGFIGGASGFDGERAFFVGDIFSHPDGKKIAAHLAERGVRCVSLADGELVDIGGIKFINIK